MILRFWVCFIFGALDWVVMMFQQRFSVFDYVVLFFLQFLTLNPLAFWCLSYGFCGSWNLVAAERRIFGNRFGSLTAIVLSVFDFFFGLASILRSINLLDVLIETSCRWWIQSRDFSVFECIMMWLLKLFELLLQVESWFAFFEEGFVSSS